MISFFNNLHPVLDAFIATLFTWGITILGASIVFLFKEPKKGIMDAMLGFAAGVMISASFWSLLLPALQMAKTLNLNATAIATVGFLLGGILLFCGDKVFSYIEKKQEKNIKSQKRAIMLLTSITLHNIPEGLAIGVAFGSVLYHLDGATIASAFILALGIGLQNFPEGSAVSLPLRREGLSRKKAFIYGSLSGVVEPISGVLGALLVMKVKNLLPILLAFAAGAMIYVVVEELIPESQTNQKKDLMALFTLIGFVIMMILDVTLGG